MSVLTRLGSRLYAIPHLQLFVYPMEMTFDRPHAIDSVTAISRFERPLSTSPSTSASLLVRESLPMAGPRMLFSSSVGLRMPKLRMAAFYDLMSKW